MPSTKIEKVFTKVNLTEQPSDFAYWQTQSHDARIAALEQIRRVSHGWGYGAEPRMAKIVTVIKRNTALAIRMAYGKSRVKS